MNETAKKLVKLITFFEHLAVNHFEYGHDRDNMEHLFGISEGLSIAKNVLLGECKIEEIAESFEREYPV